MTKTIREGDRSETAAAPGGVRRAAGRLLPLAMFLRAGITRSGREAEALYQKLIDGDPDGDYSREAVLEMAKIQFAMGRYEGAYSTLHESHACDGDEEACLFEGMAAVMLRRYDEAMTPLEHVRKGRAKVWATLSLAEATDGKGQSSEACAQYESLARARVSPAAWYRYAECLEKNGDKGEALKEYAALVEAFPLTPEAVRASEKQASPPAPATSSSEAPPPAPPGAQVSPRGAGFTIQFGSFGERANAIKMQSEIKKQYPNVRIDSELVNYKEVFRVRCGFYASRDAAQQAGEQMSKALGEPYTIMPVAASNER